MRRMMRPLWKPKVGELWRASGMIPALDGTRKLPFDVPEGTMLLVVERHRHWGILATCASGTCSIWEDCQLWDPVDVTR